MCGESSTSSVEVADQSGYEEKTWERFLVNVRGGGGRTEEEEEEDGGDGRVIGDAFSEEEEEEEEEEEAVSLLFLDDADAADDETPWHSSCPQTKSSRPRISAGTKVSTAFLTTRRLEEDQTAIVKLSERTRKRDSRRGDACNKFEEELEEEEEEETLRRVQSTP